MKTFFKIITRTIACILFVPALFIPMALWFFGILPLIYISIPIYFIFTGKCLLDHEVAQSILDPDWVEVPVNWLYNKLK